MKSKAIELELRFMLTSYLGILTEFFGKKITEEEENAMVEALVKNYSLKILKKVQRGEL